MDAVTTPPAPVNEPVLTYAPGSPERVELEAELARQEGQVVDLAAMIDGVRRMGSGREIEVVQPHDHQHVLGRMRSAGREDASAAVDAAARAAEDWRRLSLDDRSAVFLKAADLLSGPWRARLNAATMLGQSKTAIQAEIDAACELADFWRFNVHFARQVVAEQPIANSPGVWNRTDHRPLEGFVYAITPFNFTAIAGNLPTAPALMGNTVIWKPSPTQQLAADLLMQLLTEAGLPPGVINMLPGDGLEVSDVLLTHRDLAGIHFTGSTPTFQHFWQQVGGNLPSYRTYPRLVGETGGKDFVLAHASADRAALTTALVRGAFEYQGQKCSAASRAYVPASVWAEIGDDVVQEVKELSMGDVTDLGNFMGAVIDQRAFAKHREAIEGARSRPGNRLLVGGGTDDSVGWFVEPTVFEAGDPTDPLFRTEYFGPILGVHVFDDERYDAMLAVIDSTSEFALTGAVFAQDRRVLSRTAEALRFAAGNFYLNDKPTGAVVGQQPFGGARGSGTNDKAGSPLNLLRWTSPRSLKETFVPPVVTAHPHMGRR